MDIDNGWRKSSYSGDNGGGCVEVATLPDDIGVRDSMDPDPTRPVLRFSAEQWRAFTAKLKD
jgi:hypothetical protein